MNPTYRVRISIPSVVALLCLSATYIATAQERPTRLDSISENQVIHGFRATALYLNDADRAMGARFVHQHTGFTFDLLRIQSVPQAFIWVNSVPTSDMGEPHTQEHLLLGKGNAGRRHANLEGMSVASSSAFTQQLRTCYHFHTAAGSEVFFKLLASQMDALLHPDYTDEEIRREVCNLGVTENPTDGTLRLEEKGTVYNEMVSTFERGWTRVDYTLGLLLYGEGHPLALVSGGLPSAIRTMEPKDIRAFHAANYQLWNMGMVGSFPNDESLDDVLSRLDAILDDLQGDAPTHAPAPLIATLPSPHPAPSGTIRVVDYPAQNSAQPGPLLFAWPATLDLTEQERSLLTLFIDNIAGDATTNLYPIFVDPRSRRIDLGATGIFGWVSSDQGNPVFIGMGDVAPRDVTPEKIEQARRLILDEIARVAALPDDAPELLEFNRRARNRIIDLRRSMRTFVDSPPGFGYRNSGSGWMSHLDELARTDGFKKFVTRKDELTRTETMLEKGTNIWKQMMPRWNLVDRIPYACVAHPSPELIATEDHERDERIDKALKSLRSLYATNDDQETIREFRRNYDRATAELDSLAKLAPTVPFIDSPPFTLDDQIEYRTDTIAGMPAVASTFDNLIGATVGVAFRLDGTPTASLPYLSMLPSLLTGVGVIRDGVPVSHEEMSEAIRAEIGGLNAYFSTNYRTRRCELVMRGTGGDPEESHKALAWMRLALFHPDWRPENLPRIRELVDQTLADLRTTTQGSEESWVQNPEMAYWRQDDPLLLTTTSFLTREHNVHRLRWLLKDAGNPVDRKAISTFLADLASAGNHDRQDLKHFLDRVQGNTDAGAGLPTALDRLLIAFNELPKSAASTARDAATDLMWSLDEMPDESLATDWRYLCTEMRNDLLIDPARTLDALNDLRKRLLNTGNARAFAASSSDMYRSIRPDIDSIVAELGTETTSPVSYPKTRLVDTRVGKRSGDGAVPLFVGLVNPNTRGGVFINAAPGADYSKTDRESLLRFLASKLFSGHGAHSMFMKTWSAGLAYSNGLRISPGLGQVGYYAERCPELPQTIRFVIDELKKSPRDPAYVDYAIAQAFGEFRSASRYESRAEEIADDLADGLTPETVRRFRKAILALRSDPHLVDEVFDRMEKVYGDVLPGYGAKSKDVDGGIFFVIGPERQLALYEGYLKVAESPDARLYRLYPRDFWMTTETVESASKER